MKPRKIQALELRALDEAVSRVGGDLYTVYTDSDAALENIRKVRHGGRPTFLLEARRVVSAIGGRDVDLVKVKSKTSGNDLADKLAKAVSVKPVGYERLEVFPRAKK